MFPYTLCFCFQTLFQIWRIRWRPTAIGLKFWSLVQEICYIGSLFWIFLTFGCGFLWSLMIIFIIIDNIYPLPNNTFFNTLNYLGTYFCKPYIEHLCFKEYRLDIFWRSPYFPKSTESFFCLILFKILFYCSYQC